MGTDITPSNAQSADELRLTMTDLFELGYCRKGQRPNIALWGLSDYKLRKEGLPLSELEPIDNHLVQEAVAYVRRKAARTAGKAGA